MKQAATHAPAPAPRPTASLPAGRVLQRRCACGGALGPDGECAACKRKRLAAQRRAAGPAPQAASPTHPAALIAGGWALPPADRVALERQIGTFFSRNTPERPPAAPQAAGLAVSRPGEAAERQADAAAAHRPAAGQARHDFSRVRVHTDGRAAASAQAMNALAYTVGHDVVFAAGQYAPHTPAGRNLLVHELAHVVQQGHSGSTGSAVQRQTPPAAQADIPLQAALFANDGVLTDVRNKRRTLAKGDSGDAVRKVQEALLAEGYELTSAGANGSFDSTTVGAVRQFQRRWGMKSTGVVDDQVLGLLDDRLVQTGNLLAGATTGGAGGSAVEQQAAAALDVAEQQRRQTACPANAKAERKTACIQPFAIANDDGTSPTTIPDLGVARRIWEKCCINYSVLGTKVINKTDYRTLSVSSKTRTAEQSSMYANGGASNCIHVFVPEQFEEGGASGKDILGGGISDDTAGSSPKVTVVEGAAPEVLAHEIGHASGYSGHDPAGTTIMTASNKHDAVVTSVVSEPVCAAARIGAVLQGTSGTDDCCMYLR